MSAFHPETLLRPEVRALEPYTPILPFETLSRRLGRAPEQIVKLDANENPYGPVPAVREALAAYPFYHIYPDPQQEELRDELARFVGVPAAHILPTHGADEMLDYLCRLFLRPGEAIVNSPPTFGMYEFDAALEGATVVDVPRTQEQAVDVESIVAAFQNGRTPPRLIFLTSPNNPTGDWLPDADLLRLLDLPALVVLDEAYVEFADHASRAAWVLERENLVVLRTFSKAAGIAGLRLGYGICPAWLMAHLWTFKQPYNVNVAAAVAGIASLRHVEQIHAVVQKIRAERARLYARLCALEWLRPRPSQANFILCEVVEPRAAAQVKRALEAQGILVRHYNKPGLRNCIRISVGRPDQTDALLAALEEL